jgi:GDP-L-fucose synthase
MDLNSRIYIAGHNGMVGSAILRLLSDSGYKNLLFASSSEMDLTNQEQVANFFKKEQPEYVFLAAAKVGGIQANMENPAEFAYLNIMIQTNVIHQSHINKVKKLCFLGSSCIYPKDCPQPMKESYLLTGPLEPTNEGYALAKIFGLRMAQYYEKQYGLKVINPMPCNLYGKNDSFDLKHSHVLSALVKRFTDAADGSSESITLWGSGIAKREFMNVEDLAQALLFLMNNYSSSEVLNIGVGEDISIFDLARVIADKVGFKEEIKWDTSKPDGMLRKCMDVSKMLQLGFRPKITLSEGIDQMIIEYKNLKKTL